jgi:micrococcal nuclease
MDEPLGPAPRAFMIDLLDGQRIRCELNGDTTHDRWVGTCLLDGRDIG